jgi:hypothetical protein
MVRVQFMKHDLDVFTFEDLKRCFDGLNFFFSGIFQRGILECTLNAGLALVMTLRPSILNVWN